MVANALAPARERGDCRSFDWWVIRNAMGGTLQVRDGHSGLDGTHLFTLGFANMNIVRFLATFDHVNDVLDLPGSVEAHTVAD
jgi:hypothetical protein